MSAQEPDAESNDEGFLLVAFDGSQHAAAAISVGAHLMPARHARVVHLWTRPRGGSPLHRRLAHRAWTNEHLDRLVSREAAAAAKRVAADGVALARAAGWTAEPLVRGVYGGDEGLLLPDLAAELHPVAVVMGSRGLGGLRGLLGSVSDFTVNHSPVPVLVVPPLLDAERAATVDGPVMVAHDGSAGAERARTTARRLFPGRVHIVVQAEHLAIFEAPDDRETDAERQSDTPDRPGLPEGSMILPVEGYGPRAVADALGEEAAAQRAGLVVVGSRGRSMVREVLRQHRARSTAPRPQAGARGSSQFGNDQLINWG